MTSTEKPMGYDEVIAVLDAIPVLLRETRRRKGLSTRDAAEALGVSFSSVSRWERGGALCVPDLPVIVRILRWAATEGPMRTVNAAITGRLSDEEIDRIADRVLDRAAARYRQRVAL